MPKASSNVTEVYCLIHDDVSMFDFNNADTIVATINKRYKIKKPKQEDLKNVLLSRFSGFSDEQIAQQIMKHYYTTLIRQAEEIKNFLGFM